MAESKLAQRAANKVIRLGSDGEARIGGFRCGDCGAAFIEKTLACRSCASRADLQPFDAQQTGRLFSWTIVERSYPGISVPFTSAIVDLDDGLTLKGTLDGVDTASLRQGLPVGLVFDDAGGAMDDQGAPYVGFHFVRGEGN